jgi:hypothetical protein
MHMAIEQGSEMDLLRREVERERNAALALRVELERLKVAQAPGGKSVV